MCRRVTCEKCGKPSFAGCGLHIEAVLGDVPKNERCSCREAVAVSGAQPAQPKSKWWPFGS